MPGRLVILAGGIGSRMRKPPEKVIIDDCRLTKDADEKPKAMIGFGAIRRPFLDYLLYNAQEAGYRDIVIVIGDKDDQIRLYYGEKERNNDFHGLCISYALQAVPEGREKPLGTADALLQALVMREDWGDRKFTVCNSDNLYSTHALQLLLETPYDNAMIAYDRSALEFDEERIEKFAVIHKDDAGYLRRIIEKPSREEMHQARDPSGKLEVSMNVFSFYYPLILPVLQAVPLHSVRNEKELPIAVNMLATEYHGEVMNYPLSEHVPDLTSKDDILRVREEINRLYKDFRY
ncbi:MAG: NTP transferase domain-containing protein [Fidelibacterota bacterium]|nr:MAG: NTP transferase domain-containing protein [Candidatus Neomarinimicrobiota bacterium]